jgi:hypothetical protein
MYSMRRDEQNNITLAYVFLKNNLICSIFIYVYIYNKLRVMDT